MKLHWTKTPAGRKKMAEIAKLASKTPGRMASLARKSHEARKAKGHWTRTPEGRKKMAKIAALGRATLVKKIASGEIIPWQRTPEGRARLSQMGRVSQKNGRPDITDAMRTKIAARMANGGNARAIGREYGVDGNTVRAWAKKYGEHQAAKSNGRVAWGAHRRDVSDPTRALIAKRWASGKETAVAIGREYGVSSTTVRDWGKRYGRPGATRQRPSLASSNGSHANGTLAAMEACGACRTCLLCQKFGAQPQLFMCLVANPLDGGVV